MRAVTESMPPREALTNASVIATVTTTVAGIHDNSQVVVTRTNRMTAPKVTATGVATSA